MMWVIFIILLSICSVSEYIQFKNKTNNKIRLTIFIVIFIYHFLSVQGHYYSSPNFIYPISGLIGYFLPGVILTIVEIVILIKTLKDTKKTEEKSE